MNTTSCLVINSPRQKGPVRFGMCFLWFLLCIVLATLPETSSKFPRWKSTLGIWSGFFAWGKRPKTDLWGQFKPSFLFLMEGILRYFRIQNWCQVIKVHYFSKSQLSLVLGATWSHGVSKNPKVSKGEMVLAVVLGSESSRWSIQVVKKIQRCGSKPMQCTYLIYEASSMFEGWIYSPDFLGNSAENRNAHEVPPKSNS